MSPRLSLAMIVKDEAEMAPGFLESVHGLWDELVVVDTGSADGTPSLFAAAGARVLEHPWAGDFAEARNVSLEAAEGEWVLVLDADERISREASAALKKALEDPTIGALALNMVNALPFGHRRESWLVRAWRNDRSVRYRHRIHEDVTSAVTAMLSRYRWRLHKVSGPVQHLGYVRTRAAAKDKRARDVALLRRCVEADPLDFYSRFKLLEQARFWHDDALWKEEALAATDALEHSDRHALAGAPWGGELIALIAQGLFSPDSEAGLEYLLGWERWLAPSPAYFLWRGTVFERRGLEGQAEADYRRCFALSDLPGDVQLSTVRPRLGLARLAIRGARLPEALAHVEAALRDAPRDPEALVAMAALTLGTAGKSALKRWEASHRGAFPACPERDWAVGEALYGERDFAGAIVALRAAAGVPPAGAPAVRLAQALLADGQLDSAELLARSTVGSEPEAGLGVLLFDLVKGNDSELELALTRETANASMRHWVDALLSSRNAVYRKRLKQSAPAVAELFPWLPAYLAQKAG